MSSQRDQTLRLIETALGFFDPAFKAEGVWDEQAVKKLHCKLDNLRPMKRQEFDLLVDRLEAAGELMPEAVARILMGQSVGEQTIYDWVDWDRVDRARPRCHECGK